MERIKTTTARNRYGNEVKTCILEPQAHNAIHLSAVVETYTSRQLCFSTNVTINAHKNLNLNDHSLNSLIRRLGSADARTVTPAECISILNLLTTYFFPAPLSYTFAFARDKETQYGSCERCIFESSSILIALHPTNYDGWYALPTLGLLNDIAVSRLSTLLHEICHQFIEMYACFECACTPANLYNLNGHGYARQRVASWVEGAALARLGLSLKLTRIEAVEYSWEHLQVWLCEDGVERWGLVDSEARRLRAGWDQCDLQHTMDDGGVLRASASCMLM